ncbi:hypothetical protein [Thermococcus sp. 21S7]|uniref:hypothetical protein n=1 Tax=Thermococcus sp. 21S7 TaxID=1638221 RepID=UPI00143B9844|nr:hypothetical protein [Thermococcus sp. 21S7]NJE62054.1 hypothetical protein [Thermococcus sp. 21S7]
MRGLKSISILLTLLLVFSFPTATADCTPSETYAVLSVFPAGDWLLIVVGHVSWTCEMVAGEWVGRPSLPDSNRDYYILTDGKDAFLLGSVNSLLTNTTPAGFINGTLYVLRTEEAEEPFRNVTVSINGEPHNFTLFKHVTITEVYRFRGGCFEMVSRCTVTSYPNGTLTRACEGKRVNASAFGLPGVPLRGSPVRFEDGKLRFALGGKDCVLLPPAGANASRVNFTAFKAARGPVIVNMGQVVLPAGSRIEDAPLIFVPEDGRASPIGISRDFSRLLCGSPQTGGTNPSTASKTTSKEKSICGPGLVVLASVALLLLRRSQN